ncbi:MAG: 3-keto-5-aminohexanoate cleavage protein [Deltaproteobacteria bacterium]|nr:3-keto-5-aminohexanoate cleavage protein [Deltaproteobacteria bacterium]
MTLIPEDKVIITVATTGGVAGTRERNPNVPETPEEIAKATHDCWKEGASILHLHARDKDGIPTGDPVVYSEIHSRIRDLGCEIIIQDTTGTGPQVSIEDRIRCLNAVPKPEMASLDMGTMVRNSGPYEGTYSIRYGKTLEDWALKMKRAGVKPCMEVFSLSNLREVKNLISKNLLEKPYYVEFVLGQPYHGGIDASPKHLNWFIEDLPEPQDTIWGVLSTGKDQLPLTTMGIVLGGSIRVGFEDNLFYRKGELAKSNAQLVARSVRIAKELGKVPLTADETRELLGIEKI